MLVPGPSARPHCSARSCMLEIEESGAPGKGLSMAQGEKRENSVLFSLRELRQIEENRVQEEENAVRTAEEARLRAQQEAEKRRFEEEQARIQAERDHHRSIEEAKLAAERE